jgi:antitoxin component YwqK of YwqJK toxin-antitoxin module
LSEQLFSQSAFPTVYKQLETKMFYSVGLSLMTKNGVTTYKINGSIVDKPTYDKYESTWKNMETCCPCILRSYDENDILLSEQVSCTDCGVGWLREYYPNGNLRVKGQYKENPTGDWNNIWEREYCNIETGQWDYFNENGGKIYSEFWKEGEFIKQVPEQSSVEIWDVSLILNGIKIDTQAIKIDQVKNISILPGYKNRNTSQNLSFKFEVSAVGYKIVSKQFTPETFKNIDVAAMLDESGIPENEKATFLLSVYKDQKQVKSFYIRIKK